MTFAATVSPGSRQLTCDRSGSSVARRHQSIRPRLTNLLVLNDTDKVKGFFCLCGMLEIREKIYRTLEFFLMVGTIVSGPTKDMINDFWDMVWHQDCGKIVMLTNLKEENKVSQVMSTNCLKLSIKLS